MKLFEAIKKDVGLRGRLFIIVILLAVAVAFIGLATGKSFMLSYVYFALAYLYVYWAINCLFVFYDSYKKMSREELLLDPLEYSEGMVHEVDILTEEERRILDHLKAVYHNYFVRYKKHPDVRDYLLFISMMIDFMEENGRVAVNDINSIKDFTMTLFKIASSLKSSVNKHGEDPEGAIVFLLSVLELEGIIEPGPKIKNIIEAYK